MITIIHICQDLIRGINDVIQIAVCKFNTFSKIFEFWIQIAVITKIYNLAKYPAVPRDSLHCLLARTPRDIYNLSPLYIVQVIDYITGYQIMFRRSWTYPDTSRGTFVTYPLPSRGIFLTYPAGHIKLLIYKIKALKIGIYNF